MAATKEILFDGDFYDVTDFIKSHPGGRVIEYYTKKGEDSTHAIQQFHNRSKEKVRLIMSALKRRPAPHSEIGLDDVVLRKNRRLTDDFTNLYLELESEGYFRPSYLQLLIRVLEPLVFCAIGIYLYCSSSTTYNVRKCFGVLCIAVGRLRGVFIVHEFGHYSFSGSVKIDRILQSIFDGLFAGLSASRWRRQHNRHHAMPQRLQRDVDLETMPLLAYNAKVVRKPEEGKGFFVQYQAYLFVIDTLLVILFWTFYQDPKFIWKNKRYLEMFALSAHCIICYNIGIWPWLLTTWAVGFYLFFTFTLNHTHTPVTDEPTHWVEYALHHTANVQHEPWCDWATGYLNYQIEHHLFPTMPNFRFPFIRDRVRALAKKHGIPYHLYSYAEAVRKSFKNMSDVSKQLNE